MSFTLRPIGIIHSCFKEKFGIPRQAGLVKDASATLELYPEFAIKEAIRGLEGFSHIWVLFIFHQSPAKVWKPTVRPPRLGGNKKVGVFASRSPFRPNPIGLSAVKLIKIETEKKRILLRLKGVDLLDKTPVMDIKPYLPYSDIIDFAKGGFALTAPEAGLEVEFTPKAQKLCDNNSEKYPDLKKIIVQILENDPRPAYYSSQKAGSEKLFGIKIFDFDLKWRIEKNKIRVVDLIKQSSYKEKK